MTRNCKVLFLFCLLLGLGIGLLPAVPAGAVDVSDPVLDTTTKGDWPSKYGDCFYLLPNPSCTGFPQPEFGTSLDGVCTANPDGFVPSFDLRRQDGRKANSFWNTVNDCSQEPSSPGGLCGTVAEQGGTCEVDFSMCADSAQVNPCAGGVNKGTLWDEGDCITDPDFNTSFSRPLISELTINFSGSTQLAYYFAAGCGTTRVQDWELFINNISQKSGVITVTGNGQYLVFQLNDVTAGAEIRFETENQADPACPGNPNNSVLSGVFLSDCKPPPPLCSIGDFVFEDANADGCQDPNERPIEGVDVTLFEDCDSPSEIDSTTTNAEGFYEFTGLDCSKGYRVQFGPAGDIYDYTEFKSCGEPGPNDPISDSDCNGDDEGFSGCVTFPDPENKPNDPTIDCGYVCKGEIGDFVWEDLNENGCQDVGELGIGGVGVELKEGCVDAQSFDPPILTSTETDGLYEFKGLCPGVYRVKFGGGPNTDPNQMCENFLPFPDPDTKDSDCGSLDECVELTRENFVDNTRDCGKVCPLVVTKEADPNNIVCDSGTDGVDTGTNGDDCIVVCDSGTDGLCIAQTVTYTIEVFNPTDTDFTNVMVEDLQIGLMEVIDLLEGGDTRTFTVEDVCIKEPTENTVNVTIDGKLCTTASDTVTTEFDCPDTGTDGF